LNYSQIPALDINGLKAEKAIIQGGMGVGISMSGLASAVANAGGIGVISSVGIGLLAPNSKKSFKDKNQLVLQDEIRKARKKTDGIIGLNIMVAISDYDALIKLAFDEKVDIIFLGAGLPLKFPETVPIEMIKKAHTRVGVIVSSGRAANIILRTWQKNFDHLPDIVVVEGPKAGGHLGFKQEQIDDPSFKLEKLIPDVLKVVQSYEASSGKQIPVIAAGGVYSGADIHKFLQLGIQGVQMGTRFVATHECDASLEFKNAYIDCKKEDLTIIKSPVGLPGRAIRNRFLDEVTAGERKPFKCPWKCLKTCDFKTAPYCIANALLNAQMGNIDEGYTFAGANAYRVNGIVSVQDLFNTLEKEYSAAATRKVRVKTKNKSSVAA